MSPFFFSLSLSLSLLNDKLDIFNIFGKAKGSNILSWM